MNCVSAWPSVRIIFLMLIFSTSSQADSEILVYAQSTYTHKQPSSWKIEGGNPFREENLFNDLAINYKSSHMLLEDKLQLTQSLFGLAYIPFKKPGPFEKDDNSLRLLVDKLSLSYTYSDHFRVDIGKFRPQGGVFYSKSPAGLLTKNYTGFKATRINDPVMKQSYRENVWGAFLANDTPNYSLSLTIAPKLITSERNEPVGKWDVARSNTDDRYLLSYTDYRFNDNTPSVSLMIGNNQSVAFSNSLDFSPQLVISAEIAYHFQQQWRHLDGNALERMHNYEFPTQIYSANNDNNVELALGIQYTTDRFSQFGLEYYYQSEGYSTGQSKKQNELIKFLNHKNSYAPLGRVFDLYKYLMASEIYNTLNRGNLQGKNYITLYNSFFMGDSSTLQSFTVMNMQDKSSTIGLHANNPLSKSLEMYVGFYATLGSNQKEFSVFGENIGTYLGLKYQL